MATIFAIFSCCVIWLPPREMPLAQLLAKNLGLFPLSPFMVPFPRAAVDTFCATKRCDNSLLLVLMCDKV